MKLKPEKPLRTSKSRRVLVAYGCWDSATKAFFSFHTSKPSKAFCHPKDLVKLTGLEPR